MNEPILLSLWVIIAYLAALYIDRLGIPRVSTYLIAGICIGPDLLGGLFKLNFTQHTDDLTQLFMSIIAFLVGAELDLKALKGHKRGIIIGTLTQIIGAIALTSLGLYFFLPNDINLLPLVVITGAIAATTAPAATISVIDEYKAKGNLTNSILGIVILDDMFGVIFFSVILSFFMKMSNGDMLILALTKISSSFGIGLFLGGLLGVIYRYVKKEEMRFPLLLGMIMLGHFFALTYLKSSILTCMLLGLFSKLFAHEDTTHILRPIKNIEEFIFIIFFILAGSHINFSIIQESFLLILVYCLMRALGKYFGAWLGVRHDPSLGKVSHLIGLGLLPQAGLAIGLALSLTQYPEFNAISDQIINIIIGGTIVFELTGPLLTKYALSHAGEIAKSS